jgi:5'(3')-deoxyribonucleotidase
MRIKRILLDLDDVLNQLTMYTLQHVGCDVDPMENNHFPWEVGYDVVGACNLLHPVKNDWTVPEYWEAITRDVWATAPASPECDWLLQTCVELVGEDEVFIVTSPTKDPDCLAGKLEWIHRQLPSYMHRQYAITPRKYIAADSETLLIDDSYANIKAFSEHGGQTLLVPKPWNPLHGCRTASALKTFFEIYGTKIPSQLPS